MKMEIDKLKTLNVDTYIKDNCTQYITNEQIALDLQTLKYYINKILNIINEMRDKE